MIEEMVKVVSIARGCYNSYMLLKPDLLIVMEEIL